jgi:hypothetical protein
MKHADYQSIMFCGLQSIHNQRVPFLSCLKLMVFML